MNLVQISWAHDGFSSQRSHQNFDSAAESLAKLSLLPIFREIPRSHFMGPHTEKSPKAPRPQRSAFTSKLHACSRFDGTYF
jgi:hypothetical protein